MESSSSSNKRSRSHRDSSKREKQPSYREHSARKQLPKFGELIPRKSSSDELRQFANNVLGDYHSTVETIAKDQSRLMGVDRSLPITPIPGKNPVNIFDQTMKERLEKQAKTTDPFQQKSSRHLEQTLSSGSKSSKKNGDDIRHPLSSSSTLSHQSLKPHPQSHLSTKDTDSITSPLKHCKKPKKSRHFVQTDKIISHSYDESKPSLASSGKSLSFSSHYPHTFKRTNSLDDKQLVMETIQSFDHAQFASQPNEKMSVDKKKKDKRPKKSKKEQSQESAFVSSDHVIPNTSHVTTSTSRVIPPSSRSSSRPSQLTVETTFESNDVQSMLKEMSLPPFLTPIHTPCKKPEFPFLFPSAPQSTTSKATFDETIKKLDFNNISSDDEQIWKDTNTQKMSLMTSSSFHDSKLSSLPPLTSTTDIIGNISSTDDSSSDSDDSSEEEEDEKVDKTNEESTMFILEQIKNEFNAPLLDTLTPIKTSPPGRGQHPLSLVSPLLADESANLSPAKSSSRSIVRQDSRHIKMEPSLGFSVDSNKSGATTPFTPPTNFQPKAEPMTSDSDSSSSEYEESDSESSDSEDEDKTESHTSNPQNGNEDVTQPFHVSDNITARQISKPFVFEPDDISPLTDTAKLLLEPEGIHIGPKPVPSREQVIKSNSFILSQDQDTQYGKKKRRNSERDLSRQLTKLHTPYTDKLQLSDVSIEGFTEKEDSEIEVSDRRDLKTLVVQIPFSKVPDLLQQQKIKPQATVNPYNISSSRKRAGNEDDNLEQVLPPARRERRYDRQEETEVSYRGDGYHGDMRNQRDRRGWSVDFDQRNSSRRDRGRDRDGEGDGDRWERQQYTPTLLPDHNNEDYWSYHNPTVHHSYENNRREEPRDRTQYAERSRTNSSEYFYERAKNLKHEADNLPQAQGISKAIRYMQSVVYFIRHGHSQESEIKSECKDVISNKSKAFKIYSDIINMVKHCTKLGADCKPLIIICLRCQAALMWRMYMLKQSSLLQLYKELQEIFNSSSKFHQKSPNPAGSFSPLPSPASVGSTASSCSGPCSTANSAPSQEPSSSTCVSKAVCSKVTEYLTLTGYIHQGQELWKQADSLMGQYRDLFNNVDRRVGAVFHYSPIPHVAEWVECGLQSISRNP